MIAFFLLVFIIGQSFALMSIQDFDQIVKEDCFLNGKPILEPVSVENFIYLLEHFEKNFSYSMEEKIKKLLNRFSCNGIIYPDNGKSFAQETYAKDRLRFLEKFRGVETIDFPDGFSTKEKCKLFFTLSRTIFKEDAVETTSPTTTEATMPPGKEEMADTNQIFIEQGVASLNGDKVRAIALGEVLYGILGGVTNADRSMKDLVEPNDLEKNKIYADLKLNSLYSFSLAALIASFNAYGDEYFEVKGEWISNLCPKEYNIPNNNVKITTVANMLGAIDGFIIGSKILETQRKDVKLHQILRMYYSQDGFAFNSDPAISHCDRRQILVDKKERIKEEVINYLIMINLSKRNVMKQVEENAKEAADKFYELLNYIIDKTNEETESCKNKEIKTCETPINVIAVLDGRNGHYGKQLETMATVTNRLNLGLYEDTITVLTNNLQGGAEIKTIVEKTDSKVDASCALTEYNKDENIGEFAVDSIVLDAINRTLMNIEENTLLLPGAPGKVVVYYYYGKPNVKGNQEERRIDNAIRLLRIKHSDSIMISVGENVDHLKRFASDHNLYVVKDSETDLGGTLWNKICSAPALFQYPGCKKRSNQDDKDTYHGYITPDYVQYWAMPPKYFLKSFGYKLYFKAENGHIRVCMSRTPIQTQSPNKGCQHTAENKQVIEFRGSDPCKDRSVHNCDKMYFMIIGLSDNGISNTECKDEDQMTNGRGCKKLNQIKFTFKHEGLACSDAIRQIGSSFHILSAFLVMVYILVRKS